MFKRDLQRIFLNMFRRDLHRKKKYAQKRSREKKK